MLYDFASLKRFYISSQYFVGCCNQRMCHLQFIISRPLGEPQPTQTLAKDFIIN